jgi:hypothetical protein
MGLNWLDMVFMYHKFVGHALDERQPFVGHDFDETQKCGT